MKAHIVTWEQFIEFFGTEPELISANSIEAVPVNHRAYLPHAIEYEEYTGEVDEYGERKSKPVRVYIENKETK